MIKYICDWCQTETSNPYGGEFGQRVGVTVSDNPLTRMSVCFRLEFNFPQPQHLCSTCYITKIQEAVDTLREDKSGG